MVVCGRGARPEEADSCEMQLDGAGRDARGWNFLDADLDADQDISCRRAGELGGGASGLL